MFIIILCIHVRVILTGGFHFFYFFSFFFETVIPSFQSHKNTNKRNTIAGDTESLYF